MEAEILCAAVLGIRASEQVAVRWHEINFEEGWVSVETRVDNWREEDVPKSVAGTRRVFLKPRLKRALLAWRSISDYPGENDLVFPGQSGNFRDHGSMSNTHWKPIRLAVEEQFPSEDVHTNWHALRHFAVSCWIATDVNWKKIQTWIGHADIAFTMNRYGHIFEDGVDDPMIIEAIHRIYD